MSGNKCYHFNFLYFDTFTVLKTEKLFPLISILSEKRILS